MLGGTVLVLLGIALGWAVWRRVFAGYPRPAFPARVLAPRELALVGAAADALYPAGGAVAPSGSEAGVPAYTDRYMASVAAATRGLMRLLLFAVEHATLVLPAPPPRGHRRFSSLSIPQRIAVLEAWRTSRWFPRRLVFGSLRAILTMGYFAHPPVLRRLGLAPYAIDTPLCEADLLYPRVGEHPASIPHLPADLRPYAPGRPLELDAPLHPRYAEPPP